MPVSGARGPIPKNPYAQLSDWMNYVEFRLKNLEGGSARGLRGRLLELVELDATDFTFDITNISQNFQNLELIWAAYSAAASDSTREIRMHFNGDTSAAYTRQYSTDGTETQTLGTANGCKIGDIDGGLLNGEAAGWCHIYDYAEINNRKVTLGQAFSASGLAVARLETSNIWQNGSGEAIDQLTITIGNGGTTSFRAGSKFWLYAF